MKFKIPSILLLSSTLLAAPTSSWAVDRPNILFIIADDLGWSDTSNTKTNMGNPSDFFETPNLEVMADQGMAFNNAYASGPNCAPTRAAVLTGQYASRPTNNVFLVDNLNRGGNDTLLVGPDQGLPSGIDAIPSHSTTIAEAMKMSGYVTAHFGKFHVTDSAQAVINDHGFDFNFGGQSTGGPGQYHARQETFGQRIGPELDPYAKVYTQEYVDQHIKPLSVGINEDAINALVGTQKHVTDAMADAAIDFMETHKSTPFFMHYSTYAVHTPVGDTQARDDLLEKYRNKIPGQEDRNASFGALIENLDQAVARLLQYLRTAEDPRNPGQTLSENTLVVFYSDNGGRQEQSNNGPLKGQKGELSEGGVRVPMIVWSDNPQLVQSNVINSTPVASIDLFPTFIHLANLQNDELLLDGVNLSDIFVNAELPLDRKNLFWHVPGYLIDNERNLLPQTTVRSDNWKLIYLHETDAYRFYNLNTDISETNNLLQTGMSQSERQKAREMAKDMQQWLHDVNAPMPAIRATGQLLAKPEHYPGALFELGEQFSEPLDGKSTFTKELNGITLTLRAVGNQAVLSSNNAGVGVDSESDEGSVNNQRRINGDLAQPEAIEISFDQDVILKGLQIGAINTNGTETVTLSSGTNIFTGNTGYNAEYSFTDNNLAFTAVNDQETPLNIGFGNLVRSEIMLPANQTLRLSTSNARAGGVLLNSIEVVLGAAMTLACAY